MASETSPKSPLLRIRGLSVRYRATVALDGVDLDLLPGEVHAVVGENGAGKSTLVRAAAGAVEPCGGGVETHPGASVAWVPQETELPPDLRVSDWIFLGRERCGPLGWAREREMQGAAAAVLRRLGCTAGPADRVGDLSAPQRKLVQIARVLQRPPGVLLLDEPTAVLGEVETRALFSEVRALRSRGGAILYVSHRLDEVLALADRVTVLRDGERVSTDPAGRIDVSTLVRRMVGRDVPAAAARERELGPVVLRLRGLVTARVRECSLTVRRGEIVGLAGLVGAGRSEVLEAVAGFAGVLSGEIERGATPILVPEDRGRNGLVSALNLRENVFLPAAAWRLQPSSERREAREWIRRLAIRASGPDAPVESLSGGNQQKLLLARALRHDPALLVLDEPTAGVDVGAKAEIHELIRRLAGAGTAVLLASSDLPELLTLCDQIVAMRAGRVVGAAAANEASERQIAAMITGAA